MKRVEDHPLFLPAEFISIILALLLWVYFPKLSWQPLIIVIAFPLHRIFTGERPIIRTPFDLPIAIFLLTAVVGVWAAYQPSAAWTKFWYIFISILLYYSLCRQPVGTIWKVAGMLALMGFGISLYFFSSNIWEILAQKYPSIIQNGNAWMPNRPFSTSVAIQSYDITGLVLITLPFSVGLTIRFWKRRSFFWCIVFGLMAGTTIMSILLDSSRSEWVVLGATVGLWGLWLLTGWLTKKIGSFHRVLFLVSLGLLASLAIGYVLSYRGQQSDVFIGEASASSSIQRAHLFWSSIKLIKEIPFTGGGLESFSGLYSRYIRIDPNFLFSYSHNLYLDASVSQGILGGLMLCWIFLGSIFLLTLRPLPDEHSLLRSAILSSLLIITIHGVLDNILYSTTPTALLFFIPGLAVGLVNSTTQEPEKINGHKIHNRHLTLPVSILLVLVVSGLFIIRRPLISAWYTNLGAVLMAKVELSDFPTGIWDNGQQTNLLTKAETLFNQALGFEADNPHAHYRLGLIALLKRDFPLAIKHLEIAHRSDPYHRGVLKSLGFSYIWNGQIEKAVPLLSFIPESNQELAIYPWWWREQSRPDLAAYAEQYLLMDKPGDK